MSIAVAHISRTFRVNVSADFLFYFALSASPATKPQTL